MPNALTGILGGAAQGYDAADLANMTEAQRLAWYKKMNLTPPPAKASPLSRAAKWVGDKLAATPPATPPETPPATPVATGDSVSLIERLKAGNIDQVGSEAYNRWGAGKVAGEASELAGEHRRSTPSEAPPMEPPVAEATDLGANRHFTTQEWLDAPEYQQSNPMWDDLPGDEYAMKQGA